MKKNLLVNPEVERVLRQYKEEIAHEFGIHRSILETELFTKKVNEDANEKSEKEKNDMEKEDA